MNAAHAADESLSALRAAIGRAAARPLAEGTTMPPEAYTSPALLELELREIFEKEWICLGRVEEIPEPGDYFTIAVAGEPLLVVRANADTVRVLSNVCRHKWTRVAGGKGRAKRFVCPYHAWTYDLDGRLVHTRYMERTCGFDASRIALPEIRSEVWRGFIYVNIDGAAPPLKERRAELDERVGDYHMECMHLMCGDEEVWATNWKLLFENFTDLYHVFHTHRNSIGKYSPMEHFELETGGDAFSFSGSRALADAIVESPFEPHHPELREEHRSYFSMIGVYPAQMLALAPDRVFYMCLIPEGVGHVRTKWGVASCDHAMPRRTAEVIEALYRRINAEDRMRLESAHSSLRSRFAESGRISCYETMNWEFTRYLDRRLNGAASAGTGFAGNGASEQWSAYPSAGA